MFWRKIRAKDLDENYLAHVEYAFLGLGDTNYTTFLGYPKSVEKHLQKLGAKPFYTSGWADDAVGLEIVVDPWIENLWPALENHKANLHQVQATTTPNIETAKETEKLVEPAIIATTLVDAAKTLVVDKPVENAKQEQELEKCLADLASLKVSVTPLSGCDLKVPLLPVSYLELKYNSELMVGLF